MSRKTIGASIAAVAVVGTAVALLLRGSHPRLAREIVGAVLVQDQDPRKQVPIPNVQITASDGRATAQSQSDASGFFRLRLPAGIWREAVVSLGLRHPDYQPLVVKGRFGKQICVARLLPRASAVRADAGAPDVLLSDIRVRYSMRDRTAVNVGSIVKAFEVANRGDIACDRRPCSPDGKWRAAARSESFDAGEGHEFRNVRLSCIAGPCPFTRIGPALPSQNGRLVQVSVLNWSDTATFLFEAEVMRSTPTDITRQLYPAIFGRNMNFTLPSTAQGPSIEADVNGAAIVFPLGPTLQLSWAACNLKVGRDNTKLYSCELRPGYRFR